MGERTAAIAEIFSNASQEVVAIAETCTEEQWQTLLPEEGWTVGATLRHLAGGMSLNAYWLSKVANGKPVTTTMDAIHEGNHQFETMTQTRDEVIHELQQARAKVLAVIENLADEQLDVSAPISMAEGKVLTTNQVIRHIVLRHIREHISHIKEALEKG